MDRDHRDAPPLPCVLSRVAGRGLHRRCRRRHLRLGLTLQSLPRLLARHRDAQQQPQRPALLAALVAAIVAATPATLPHCVLLTLRTALPRPRAVRPRCHPTARQAWQARRRGAPPASAATVSAEVRAPKARPKVRAAGAARAAWRWRWRWRWRVAVEPIERGQQLARLEAGHVHIVLPLPQPRGAPVPVGALLHLLRLRGSQRGLPAHEQGSARVRQQLEPPAPAQPLEIDQVAPLRMPLQAHPPVGGRALARGLAHVAARVRPSHAARVDPARVCLAHGD
eukprot:scaffold2419_cov58-Phaeocystis_antarctica.AAC.3